ncbi:hypothetical protein [uncultured Celeribacter sp.]|uniref:hypothetical protein n=1 Tax=uncultured Celeribacter sp. TaxID=1303376 RepID=UPI002AA6E863|nr:hypothetical protein [uncultured Celeribacter sp.]
MHVHFDLTEYERKMREMHEASFPAVMAKAKNDRERLGYELQDRFFETQLAAQIEIMRMANEGRGAQDLGHATAVFVTNVVMNMISVSPDPSVSLNLIYRVMANGIRALAGDDPEGFSLHSGDFCGSVGGRA